MKRAFLLLPLLSLLLMPPTAPPVFANQVQPRPRLYVPPLLGYRSEAEPLGGFTCPSIPGTNSSDCSRNWSGYVVAAANGSVSAVGGSWIVPAVSCSGTSSTFASFWVGIDGYDSLTVEQVGTDSDCLAGVPFYYAWYEFYPNASVPIDSVNVTPGDLITASVAYGADGRFTTSVSSSEGGSNSTSQAVPGAQRNSAEWIAERPQECFGRGCSPSALSPFGTVDFGSYFTGLTGGSDNATIGHLTGPISKFPRVAVTMISDVSGPVLAEPTPLLNDSGSFQVNSRGTLVTLSCAPTGIAAGSPASCDAQVAGVSPTGKLASPIPTGKVTWATNSSGRFSALSCRLSKGTCRVRYTPTSAGLAVISASYGGDSNYRPSFTTFSILASPGTSKVAVSCTLTSVRAGSSKQVRCTAVVTGLSPSGTVSWSQSGGGSVAFVAVTCTLVNNRCSVLLNGTTSGGVTIVASYGGDTSNSQSSNTVKLVVGVARPSLSVLCTTTTLWQVGSTTECTATLAGFAGSVEGENVTWSRTTSAGNVVLSSPSCPLSSAGICSISVTGVSSPGAKVKVAYPGDSNNAGSFKTVPFVVV